MVYISVVSKFDFITQADCTMHLNVTWETSTNIVGILGRNISEYIRNATENASFLTLDAYNDLVFQNNLLLSGKVVRNKRTFSTIRNNNSNRSQEQSIESKTKSLALSNEGNQNENVSLTNTASNKTRCDDVFLNHNGEDGNENGQQCPALNKRMIKPIKIRGRKKSSSTSTGFSRRSCKSLRLGSSFSNETNVHGRTYKASRTTFMLFIVTLAFMVTFAPYCIVALLRNLEGVGYYSKLTDIQKTVYQLFLRSYFLSSAINPIIYSFLNQSFKSRSKTILKKIFNKGRQGGQGENTINEGSPFLVKQEQGWSDIQTPGDPGLMNSAFLGESDDDSVPWDTETQGSYGGQDTPYTCKSQLNPAQRDNRYRSQAHDYEKGHTGNIKGEWYPPSQNSNTGYQQQGYGGPSQPGDNLDESQGFSPAPYHQDGGNQNTWRPGETPRSRYEKHQQGRASQRSKGPRDRNN
ncbi:unnamed protein product [Mytilus coruscus]|uniref:G-protein coupled receptors family 1 profile domain-containing protein n=1 Tax=Mytilus coruscus TaxID=42192 RepID=A0A6J8B7S3_MYTCO|nr:unnamed protein product [Mytilus coruscus]